MCSGGWLGLGIDGAGHVGAHHSGVWVERAARDPDAAPVQLGLAYLYPDGGGRSSLIKQLQLPAAWWNYAEGVMALKAHNDTGHVSFLLGNLKAGGWWYFYLVALAVKTPLPLLLSGVVGLGLLARDGLRQASTWRMAPVVLFVTLLVFASGFSRINIGIRHVLILYPFLALGAAYALVCAWRAWPRVGTAVAVLLVVWQVSTLVHGLSRLLSVFQ